MFLMVKIVGHAKQEPIYSKVFVWLEILSVLLLVQQATAPHVLTVIFLPRHFA
jgi:hypothetical protein